MLRGAHRLDAWRQGTDCNVEFTRQNGTIRVESLMCPVAKERHPAQVLLKKTKEQISQVRTLEGEKEWSRKQRCDFVQKARNIKAEDVLKHHGRCVCVCPWKQP